MRGGEPWSGPSAVRLVRALDFVRDAEGWAAVCPHFVTIKKLA